MIAVLHSVRRCHQATHLRHLEKNAQLASRPLRAHSTKRAFRRGAVCASWLLGPARAQPPRPPQPLCTPAAHPCVEDRSPTALGTPPGCQAPFAAQLLPDPPPPLDARAPLHHEAGLHRYELSVPSHSAAFCHRASSAGSAAAAGRILPSNSPAMPLLSRCPPCSARPGREVPGLLLCRRRRHKQAGGCMDADCRGRSRGCLG